MERSVREEWAEGPGEKSPERWFRKGTATPIGQRHEQEIVSGGDGENLKPVSIRHDNDGVRKRAQAFKRAV